MNIYCYINNLKFKNYVVILLEYASNYFCEALCETIPKRHLYWIKNSLELSIVFCFVSVVFCLSFFLSPSHNLYLGEITLNSQSGLFCSSQHNSRNEVICIAAYCQFTVTVMLMNVAFRCLTDVCLCNFLESYFQLLFIVMSLNRKHRSKNLALNNFSTKNLWETNNVIVISIITKYMWFWY